MISYLYLRFGGIKVEYYIDLVLKKEKKAIALDVLYEKVEKLFIKDNPSFLGLSVADKKEIEKILMDGVADYKYYKTPFGKYSAIYKTSFRKGRFYGTRSSNGIVSVVSDRQVVDGNHVVNIENYEISKENVAGAIDGDLVLIDIGNKNLKPRIVKILNRNLEYVMGEVYLLGNSYFVKPIDKKKQNLTIALEGEAIEGQRVEVELKKQTTDNFYIGEIIRTFNHKDDPNEDILWEAYKLGIDDKFSKETIEQVKNIPLTVRDIDKIGRSDLTDWEIFTIDGDDTKDIDDAISIEVDGDNLILRVSIADVSHYLLQYPALIREAVNRGNSAYFADSVVPMLPHILSNGICSLNPGVDRLTKTAELVFNSDGEIVSTDVYKSVIRSTKKMNYDDVNQILENDIIPDGYEEFADNLILMEKLSKLATAHRNAKGNLNFSDLEFKIHTAIDGAPTDLSRCFQLKGERLIENFMIMANIAVTEIYGYLGQPFVYRTHDVPDLIKLQKTIQILKEQGIFSEKMINNLLAKLERVIQKNSEIKPNDLQPLLKEARKNGSIDGVSNLLLRTMKKAGYSPINIGHFGLAEENYCHFTSPIRRAADLMNHIIIDLVMEMNNTFYDEEIMLIQEKLDMISKALPSICEHISYREIAADRAEMEIEELKTIKYFIDHIEDYEGPILAEVLNSNKFGLRILVDNKIRAIMDAKELTQLGYVYMRDSRTYVRSKTNDCFKLGTRFYVLDPEASLQYKTIKYGTAYTMDEKKN